MKSRGIYLFIIVVILFIANKSEAQDFHFSQFYAAPLYLNPAMTGTFEGQFRVGAIYRGQWSSILTDVPFRTYGFSADYRYNILGNDYIAGGLNLQRDEAGTSRFYQTKGSISLSYMKQLSGGRFQKTAQYLIAGAQLGIAQNEINWNNLRFSRQFNATTELFDPTLSTDEIIGNEMTRYLDFNAGVLWYSVFGENASIYAGGALNHLNAPNYSFYDNVEDILKIRWIGHAGGEVSISNGLSLLPAFILMGQGNTFETNFGANFRFSGEDWNEVALRIGSWARLTSDVEQSVVFESVIVTTMLELNRWLLGISYDLNTSNLMDITNSRGAVEISLQYIHPENTRYGVSCPKF